MSLTFFQIRKLFLVFFIMVFAHANIAIAQSDSKFITAAKQGILLDSRSGTVYFEKNADELMPPASMSKVMTMLMVFEGLKDGSLKLDDEFVISEDAWRRGGAPSGSSTMYAKIHSRVKLKDLMYGVIIQSANDAAIAIAEGMAGSESAFAERMTKRAHELGMTHSTFKNATGLPQEDNQVTARELAHLTRYLIEVFPEYYKIFSHPNFTWNNIKQGNRNPLLRKYPGADGVKTGHTKESGYGLIGSAKKDSRRLILVLNGMKSKKERSLESIKLMDWGFRQFQKVSLFRSGDKVSKARVWGGEKSTVQLVAKDDIVVRLSKKEKANAKLSVVFNGPLAAPISKGRQVGKVVIKLDNKTIATAPIITKESIASVDSMWSKAFDTVLYQVFGG